MNDLILSAGKTTNLGRAQFKSFLCMKRTFKYRIYPSKSQIKMLELNLAICCDLYNAAIQERKSAWDTSHKIINFYTQANQLSDIKQICPELKLVYAQVLQNTLKRVDIAFSRFFAQAKAGKSAGLPRFRKRFNSFTYPQNGFSLSGNKIKLSKIGNVKIKLHRQIAGKISTLTIKQSATGKWFACFCVDTEPVVILHTEKSVGVDFGIKAFATLSSGEIIKNPKFLIKEKKNLAKACKNLNACKDNALTYNKCRKVFARIHERVANRRRNFLHQESRKLVNRFRIIAFENLNLQKMMQNSGFAKSILDASWKRFVRFTIYKAESAGSRVVQVDPKNTSQLCSTCGKIVEKKLSTRTHNCKNCGLKINRDHNAAINVLALGLQSISLL